MAHLLNNHQKKCFDDNHYFTLEEDIKRIVRIELARLINSNKKFSLDGILKNVSEKNETYAHLIHKCVLRVKIMDLKEFKCLNPIKLSVDLSEKNWYSELCKNLHTVKICDDNGNELSESDRKKIGMKKIFHCFSTLPKNFNLKSKYLFGNVNWEKKWNKLLHELMINKLTDMISNFDENQMKDAISGHKYLEFLNLFNTQIENPELYKEIDPSFENEEQKFKIFAKGD